MRRLTAYLDGVRAGWFTQDDAGRIAFDVDADWADRTQGLELSLSLPKARRRHDGPAPANYLTGLLPDDQDVIRRWAARFGVSAGNPMALLEHVGLDTAGGVQLSPDDAATLEAPREWIPLADADIGRHLAELRADRTEWMFSRQRPQSFSLAGAQGKFALTDAHGGWALPLGGEPTTHIVKPGAAGFAKQDLVEHLSLRAACHLGLDVAESRIMVFAGQPAIVVTRYDRARDDGLVRRLHQEDLVQAFGLPPARKYQSDGGPGMAAIAGLLRANLRSQDADAAVKAFFDLCAFNWVALATDGHAKNFSLLHSRHGPTLAPGYDIASALPYPDIADPWTVRLAMRVGGRYRDRDILSRHWGREAAAAGLDPDQATAELRVMVERFPAAMAEAARESDLADEDARLAARLTDLAAARAETLAGRLSD
jgi:serine/threonine-protein kinase HipA